MRVLVTGGAGFIGSHLVDELLKCAVQEVVVVDDLRRGQLRNIGNALPKVRFVRLDVRDYTALREAAEGVKLIYHLAAQSRVLESLQHPEECLSCNVTGTYNVLVAAGSAGVQKVVFASSREVYGDSERLPVDEQAQLRPKNPYGASKAAAEAWCSCFDQSGLPVAVLRLGNVYGPRDHGRVIPTFLDNAQKGLPLQVFGGEQIVDFVSVKTVVRAMISAGERSAARGPINVAGGRGTTVLDLARRILSVTNSSSRIEVVSRSAAEVGGFVADIRRAEALLGLRRVRDPLHMLRALVQIDVPKTQGISRATL